MRELAAKAWVATVLAWAGCARADRIVADYGATAGGAASSGATNGGASGGATSGGASGGASNGSSTFSVPTPVTGLRASDIDLHDPSLTGDELEIFFASDTDGSSDIWTSTRASSAGQWAPATRVEELSTGEDDIDPDVSPDGSTLYLSSSRGALGYQLFVSRRAGRTGTWSGPEAVLGIPTSNYNFGPSVDAAGLLMAFAIQKSGPDAIFLYSAARATTAEAWQTVEPMSSLTSDYQDQNPALFDDGRGLVFSSRRTDQGRTSDLFISTRAQRTQPWSAPSPIVELDTDSWEGDPWLSQDGRHILFVSDRVAGVSRIYEARR
ncbi:MAG TPA: hypothetical protein VJV79_02980 [Polyangiaceae bacterium]|nr:hypothetical protein [Polyangiaceae bacterium]